MRFVAILNREGGTLRTTDLEAFEAHIRKTLTGAGHLVDVHVVDPDDIEDALNKAAADEEIDVVMVGGGDGTVSSAAAALMDKEKALAILPAGTMNLFARSLGIPLDIEAAVTAFANGRERRVDIATADGKPYVHQFSIGMHAEMVKLRDRMEFRSKLGKISASMRAAWQTVMNPPVLKVELEIDGKRQKLLTTGIGVSNNLFGEGHIPYADKPDEGVLGVYVTRALRRSELLSYAWKATRGIWEENEQVDVHSGHEVTVRLVSSHRRFRCVIDGELCQLRKETHLRIHPGSLKVLVPSEAEAAGEAEAETA
jgi:diacylglycerol kinase family enzyme